MLASYISNYDALRLVPTGVFPGTEISRWVLQPAQSVSGPYLNDYRASYFAQYVKFMLAHMLKEKATCYSQHDSKVFQLIKEFEAPLISLLYARDNFNLQNQIQIRCKFVIDCLLQLEQVAKDPSSEASQRGILSLQANIAPDSQDFRDYGYGNQSDPVVDLFHVLHDLMNALVLAISCGRVGYAVQHGSMWRTNLGTYNSVKAEVRDLLKDVAYEQFHSAAVKIGA